MENNTVKKDVEANVESLELSLKNIERPLHVKIYFPPGYSREKEYPVLYLFHGNGSSESAVFENLKLENIATGLIEGKLIEPSLIVVPRWQALELPATWHYDLLVELVKTIDGKYSTCQKKSKRCLGGFSLGGQLALQVAFTDNSLFGRVGGHMPAIREEGFKSSIEYKQTNPFELVKNISQDDTSYYFDCGEDDEHLLFKGCKAMYDILKSKNIHVQNYLNKGAHDNDYLKEHIAGYLKFYLG